MPARPHDSERLPQLCPYPVQLIELRYEFLWPAEVIGLRRGWSCLVKVLLKIGMYVGIGEE